MRILVLHQNKFERLGYDRAFDHERHDVVYAGTPAYIAGIPASVRCETFTLEERRPVAEQLADWMATQEPFERVLARHEQLIEPAAALRAGFGIPGMQPGQALGFRDKVVMKTRVAAAGLSVPRFVPADEVGEHRPWHGPTIVKPRGGAASHGVHRCESFDAARALVADRLRDDPAFAAGYELEEYLAGPIWHVDGYLHEGQPVAAVPSRYIGTCLDMDGGAPLGSVQYPNAHMQHFAVECLRALGGGSLTFHLEAIDTADGPVFMEVAARCGGGHIVGMTHRRTGVHVHTVDMASEIEGALATWLIEPPAKPSFNGMFLYPGHVYGGAPIEVDVPADMLTARCLVAHQIFPAGKPTPTAGGYRPENLPFSGLVSADDPDELRAWLERLFAAVTVRPTGLREELPGVVHADA